MLDAPAPFNAALCVNRKMNLETAQRYWGQPMRNLVFTAFISVVLVTGCASTKVEMTGTPMKEPLCHAGKPAVSTLVYWGPKWRPDQKDPQRREAAALRGIQGFLKLPVQCECGQTRGELLSNALPLIHPIDAFLDDARDIQRKGNGYGLGDEMLLEGELPFRPQEAIVDALLTFELKKMLQLALA